MMIPSFFNDNFVDSFFDDMFSLPRIGASDSRPSNTIMRTDVKDLGENYQLDIELPGYAKEEVHAELSKGYLIISAQKTSEKTEKEEGGKYVRRERYSGNCQRSFYVGENLREEDIKASFENGILRLIFPKSEQRKVIEQKKYISIE